MCEGQGAASEHLVVGPGGGGHHLPPAAGGLVVAVLARRHLDHLAHQGAQQRGHLHRVVALLHSVCVLSVSIPLLDSKEDDSINRQKWDLPALPWVC